MPARQLLVRQPPIPIHNNYEPRSSQPTRSCQHENAWTGFRGRSEGGQRPSIKPCSVWSGYLHRPQHPQHQHDSTQAREPVLQVSDAYSLSLSALTRYLSLGSPSSIPYSSMQATRLRRRRGRVLRPSMPAQVSSSRTPRFVLLIIRTLIEAYAGLTVTLYSTAQTCSVYGMSLSAGSVVLALTSYVGLQVTSMVAWAIPQ